MDEALARYRQTLIDIIRLCRKRNQQILFLTQPTLYQKQMPEDLRALLWQHCDDGAYTPEVLENLLDRLNETLVSVCQEENVPLVDLAAELPKDTTVFYDDCHFNTSGSLRVAEIIAEFFSKRLNSSP